ncbi:MAG: hypothetical protein KBS81_08765, partial [Spirochaetales bacterium]|nr:hypothetical protein [Candidatus Physcosoma equi]
MISKHINSSLLLVLVFLFVGSFLPLAAQPAQETVKTTTTQNPNGTVMAPEPLEASATTNNWNLPPEGMVPPEGMMPPDGMFPPEGMTPPEGMMPQDRFDRMNMGGMKGGMMGGMGSLGAEATLSSTLDSTPYLESVSSEENPLTYYDAEDILHEDDYKEVTIT